MPSWTHQQLTAINARGGGMLVSAAAGSGKTAVLTERIITKILDREHPVDADKFLVVTFTRAAAAEMRTRIRARLRQELAENPSDRFLQRQMMLLSSAKICTMDAFFHSLVRENFEQLGLSPNLRGVDDAMLTKMTAETLSALLEEQYLMARAGENDDFIELTGYFGVENDKALSDELLSFYQKLRSLPFPEVWMERQLALYDAADALPGDTDWGKTILSRAAGLADSAALLLQMILDTAIKSALAGDKTLSQLREEAESSLLLCRLLKEGGWDEALDCCKNIFAGHRIVYLKSADPADKETMKAYRELAKELIGQVEKLFICREAEFSADLKAERKVIGSFFKLVTDFSQRLSAAKEAAGVADFNDFAAFALKLVANPDGTPTPFAGELSARYEEIMLDEYQDTNRLQDMIFTSISKNGENLFYVGDLKQSIYRFRSANPAVFLEKKLAFTPYDEEGHFPALLLLSKNFRSREAVTAACNYLFSCVMSPEVGDVAYDGSEALHCGADYYPPLPENDPAITLLLTDGAALPPDEAEEESPSLYLLEARALAREIKRMLISGTPVYDKESGSMRPVKGGDIVILMRSVKGIDTLYAEALRSEGVDARLATASGYFSSREVSLMIAMLQALDNPTRDTELAAVLLSPVFGFNCDDLAALTLTRDGGSLYRALIRAAEGDESDPLTGKAGRFLVLFRQLRAKSAVSSISTLIQYIYDRTDFIELINRTERDAGELNLRLLLKYAVDYETGGVSELSGFVSYLQALAERQQDFKAATPPAENETAVRIMTIHRSKGLEFPVVAIAACSKRFNIRDLTGMTVFHPEAGFGMRRVEREALKRYETLPFAAIAARQKQDMISEEMRLLYVAVTRAKERLILCTAAKDLGKKLRNTASLFAGSVSGSLTPASSGRCSSYTDWILSAMLRHPAMQELRADLGIDTPDYLPPQFDLRIIRADVSKLNTQSAEQDAPLADEDAKMLLLDRFDYQYPYAKCTLLPSKLSVTRITHGKKKLTLRTPRFAAGGRLAEELGDEVAAEKRASESAGMTDSLRFTPAQKGTIFHRALQFADYQKGREDPDAELSRLQQMAYLTPEEAETIDRREFAAFFRSGLMERMLGADKLYREYKFFGSIAAKDAGFPDGGEEMILLQGIADCIFIENGALYIVDFKTDRVSRMSTLIDRYQNQLRLYRDAIMAIDRFNTFRFGGCLIYSTCLGQVGKVEEKKVKSEE